MNSTKKRIIVFLGVVVVIVFIFWYSIQPSNYRNWSEDQMVLSFAEFNNNLVNVHNIRNFDYEQIDKYEKNYYDAIFDIDKLKGVYFIVEPFSGYKGSAHTFISFEFEDNKFIAISIEIRKEKGESFSALKGLLKQYEIIYVVGDERDLVKLRSNYRKDNVYIYPIKTTKEKKVALFKDIFERINKLKDSPEFYNTVTNNCTNNLAKHANNITPKKIPFVKELFLPENSDKILYDIGLIDTELSFEEAREMFLINERALKYADDDSFSTKIRYR